MSTASLSITDWNLEPSVIVGLLVLAAAYALAVRRGVLTASDDVSPWFRSAALRPWFLGAGLLIAFVALQSPIDVGGDLYLLSIHMVQHLLLMLVAPPLVLLGIVGVTPPPPRVQRRLRAVWTWATRPWQAVLIFNVVLLVWHVPALYNTTLTNDPLHILEHLTFVAVGLVFWWPIVDPVRGSTTVAVGPFQKIAMLVIAGVPPTVLGFIFALGRHAFYPFYEAAPRLWGMSPTGDQAAAGVIMLGLGNLIYFVAVSVIFLRIFQSPEDDEAAAEIELARQR